MGRTIPSYRISLDEELKRWKRFQDVLRIDERAIFQEMMDECSRHASAAGAACFPSARRRKTHNGNLKERSERLRVSGRRMWTVC